MCAVRSARARVCDFAHGTASYAHNGPFKFRMEKNVEAYIVADSNTCTQIIDPLSVFADALSSHLKHCVDALYRMGISLILWSRCTNSFNWTNRQQTNKQTCTNKYMIAHLVWMQLSFSTCFFASNYSVSHSLSLCHLQMYIYGCLCVWCMY